MIWGFIKRLFSASVWGKETLAQEPRKYRRYKKLYLPLIDLLIIIGGFLAIAKGIPAIDELFPDFVVNLAGRILYLSAFTALLGVAWPKLWVVESIAKLIMLALIGGYAVALVFLAGADIGNRGFVSVIALCVVVVFAMRLDMLAEEWAKRRADDREAKLQLAILKGLESEAS